MILLVGRDATALSDALSTGRRSRVASVAEAERLFADAGATPDLVVVDRSADGADDLMRSLRDGVDPRCSIVVYAHGPSPDLSLRSIDAVVDADADDAAAALDAAVGRGLRISDYFDAVDRLYAECRTRARTGETDPLTESGALSDARDDADTLLATLVADGVALSDLLNASVAPSEE